MTPRRHDLTAADIYDSGSAGPQRRPAEVERPPQRIWGMYRVRNIPGAEQPGIQLSSNEVEWRRIITETVNQYRRTRSGAFPSFRAFALLASGGDTGAVDTWRARVRRHPAIVDPSLNWPQGEAVARAARNARTMHASVG